MSRVWLSVVVATAFLASSVLYGTDNDLAAAEPTGREQTSMRQRMRLSNQSVGFGEIVSCSQPGLLGWRDQGFDEPFFFELRAIQSINRISAAGHQLKTDGPYFRVKTISGDVFAGTLTLLDSERLTVTSPALGEVEIDREHVLSLVKAGSLGEVVYPGLIESENWKPLSRDRDWDVTGGVLTALRQGASILGNLDLPDKCKIFLSVTWKGVPDFVLSLGTDSQQRQGPVTASARIEAWSRNMVLVRETHQSADLTRLAELNPGINQVELTILLDQSQGLVSVLDYSGRSLGRIAIPATEPSANPCIRIDNYGPSLTIERLEVHQWDGISLLESDQTNCVILNSGEVRQGTIVELNPGASTLRIVSPTEQVEELDVDQVAFIGLSPPRMETEDGPTAAEAGPEEANLEEADPDDLEVELVLADTSRLLAQWSPTDDSLLRVYSQYWQRAFEFRNQDVMGITPTHQHTLAPSTGSRNGVLTIGDTKIFGILEERSADFGERALRWKPHGSTNSSPLSQTVPGSIVYPFHHADSQSQISAEQKKVRTGWPITFVSGDTIDGEVLKIDRKGVYLRSNDSPIRFAGHDQLANVSLNALNSAVKPPAQFKADRLMQLPRKMKADPPSHLLLAVDGDLLRCRLIEMDASRAVVEVRREIVSMARTQISQIVWLHSREWNDQEQDSEAQPLATGATLQENRVHVMLNGRGVTLVPQQLHSGQLVGESELLGTCRISLKEISQILFGPRLDSRIAELRENPWVLTVMPPPKAFIESD